MAHVLRNDVISATSRRHVVVATNKFDTAAGQEVAAIKVDISTLDGAPSAVRIAKVAYDVTGMIVHVGFDHTADQFVMYLGGSGVMDFTNEGGLKDPGGAGGTGDIVFSTTAGASGDFYTIVLWLEY